MLCRNRKPQIFFGSRGKLKNPQKYRECGLEGARNNIHKIGQVNNCPLYITQNFEKNQPNRHGVMVPKREPIGENFSNLTGAENCTIESDDGWLSCIRPIVKLLTKKTNLFDSSCLEFLIEFEERHGESHVRGPTIVPESVSIKQAKIDQTWKNEQKKRKVQV